jgi:hypothetical protein
MAFGFWGTISITLYLEKPFPCRMARLDEITSAKCKTTSAIARSPRQRATRN